jgi:hypothetical protein
MTTAALEAYMAGITAQAAQTSATWDPTSLSPVQMSQLYQALQLSPSNSTAVTVQGTLYKGSVNPTANVPSAAKPPTTASAVENDPPTVSVPMVSQAAAASTGLVVPPPVVSSLTASSPTPPATSTAYLASEILISGVPLGSGGLPSPSDVALGVSVTLGPTGATATDNGASGIMPSVSGPGPASPPFPMGNNTVVVTYGGPSLTAGMGPSNTTGLVPFQGKGPGRRALVAKWPWAIITCAAIVFRPRL